MVDDVTGIRANVALNLGFALLPVGVFLATVPLYIDAIGLTRYGLLSIVWIMVGYAALLDLGVGRALIYRIAESRDAAADIRRRAAWTGLALTAAAGLIAAAVFAILAAPLLVAWIPTDPELGAEIVASGPWIAAGVALALFSSSVGSLLEGVERFLAVNSAQLAAQVLTAAVPLAAAMMVSPRLDLVIAVTVLARFVPTLALFAFAALTLRLGRPVWPRRSEAVRLLRFGGWVTVSGVISPLLTSLDRVLIAGLAGPAAVALYAVPFGLANRLLLLPAAVVRTIFPRLAATAAGATKPAGEPAAAAIAAVAPATPETRQSAARGLSVRVLHALAGIMTPICCVAIIAIEPFLALWIDPAFARAAGPLGEILIAGIFVNALAFLPYGYLQGTGDPRGPALLHLIEIVPFVAVLWTGLAWFGLAGAATAWTLRVTVDAALLARRARFRRHDLAPLAASGVLIALALAVAAADPSLPGSVAAAAVLATSAAAVGLRQSRDLRETAEGLATVIASRRRRRPAPVAGGRP